MKGIIFDMDGVLFDTEAIWHEVWVQLAEENGVTLPESFYKDIGGSSSIMGLVVARYFHLDDGWDIVHDGFRRVDERLLSGVPEMPYLHECLESVKKAGFTLAVASSSYLHTIERNLEQTDTAGYFKAIVSGDQITNGKPAPDIFLLAAEKMGLPPEECYVLEDSLNGIIAADRAAMKPIMVVNLFEPTEEIRKLCYGIVTDLNQAAELITGK